MTDEAKRTSDDEEGRANAPEAGRADAEPVEAGSSADDAERDDDVAAEPGAERDSGEGSDEAQSEKTTTDDLPRNRRARRAAEAGAPTPEDLAQKDRNKRLREGSTRRKQRERERAAAVAQGLATNERVEDALSRSAVATTKFVQSQFAWLQWVIVLGLAAAIGVLVYRYRSESRAEKEGDRLGGVLATATARIASTETPQQADRNLVDNRPEFTTVAARAEEAAKDWSELTNHETPEIRLYALLARAATFVDLKKWDEARKLYESALGDGVATASVKARAQEGLGLVLEGESKRPEAITAFEKMGSFGLPEFKNLGRFHAARVRFQLGDKAKAQADLEALQKDLAKGASPTAPKGYLLGATEDLLKTIDPKAAAEAGAGAISPEQLEQFRKQIEAMQKAAEKGGSTPGSEAPAPGAPAPGGPSEGAPEGENPFGPYAPEEPAP